MDLSPAHSLALSTAASYVGLTGDDYIAIIAAPELAAGMTGRAREMGAMSGCGLVYLALAREAFGAPVGLYHTGDAFSLIYALAGSTPWGPSLPGSALRIPTFTEPPIVSDALIWGDNGPAHPAHVDACVDTVEEPDPYSASSPPTLWLGVIAGGQRDGSWWKTVARLGRVLRWDGRGWVDQGNGRRLLAVIGADAMAERYASPL